MESIYRKVKDMTKNYRAMDQWEDAGEEEDKSDTEEDEDTYGEPEPLLLEEVWEQEVYGDMYWDNSDWENEVD